MSVPDLLLSTPLLTNKGLANCAKEILEKSDISQFIKNYKLNLPNSEPKCLPIHLKKNMPNANRQFIQWLVGFTDAEGFFYIYSNKDWTAVSLRFSIELHIDDIDVLHEIHRTLGVGRVVSYSKRSSAIFYVVNLHDIIRVIIPIFQEFPLQTSKYLDFTCFSKVASIKSKYLEGATKISKTELIAIKKLKETMNSKRLTMNKKQEDNLRDKVSINIWWLLGFVEGEGTFGYKHLVPYFQIAQHKKNLFILEAIETFLSKVFKESTNTLGFEEFKVKYTLNKGTGVYSMTVEKIDLMIYLIPLFQSLSFFTRKSVDYHYWVISVVMHKFGYYYLPEGKKIALQISSGTNKYRYSTNDLNKTELPSVYSISELFAQTPPFNVNSGSSHFDLVREFTISRGGRKGFIVYVYTRESEEYKELKGSPFSTYGAGHVAIGQKAGSRVIGRYIDTGKAYKDKYIFSSVPL